MFPEFFVRVSDLVDLYPNLMDIVSKNQYIFEAKEYDGWQCVRAISGHTIDFRKLQPE